MIIKDQEYLDFLQWLKNMGCPKTKLTLADFSSNVPNAQLRSIVCRFALAPFSSQGVAFLRNISQPSFSISHPPNHVLSNRYWSWYDGNKGHQGNNKHGVHQNNGYTKEHTTQPAQIHAAQLHTMENHWLCVCVVPHLPTSEIVLFVPRATQAFSSIAFYFF